MLFIMSLEADEGKGQAPVCGADASAPVSFAGSSFSRIRHCEIGTWEAEAWRRVHLFR